MRPEMYYHVTDDDCLAVYEHVRSNPITSSSTAVAKALGWRTSDGKPYHMRAKRIIDRLIRQGYIKRQIGAHGPSGKSGQAFRYTTLRAPIPANKPEEPAFELLHRTGVMIEGRRLYTAADAVKLICHIANLTRGFD